MYVVVSSDTGVRPCCTNCSIWQGSCARTHVSDLLIGSGVLTTPLLAQVHPYIAPFQQAYETSGTTPPTVHGNSPLFNYRDGLWNNGEGFAASSAPDADFGGWRGLDNGTGVTLADVREYPYPSSSPYSAGWHSYTHIEEITSNGPQSMYRWVGYLRPAGMPDAHGSDHPDPAVRNVPANQSVVWANDAAFELFVPTVPRNGRPVILVVGIIATFGIPDQGTQSRLIYPGIGGPDGLMRARPTNAALWYQNLGDPQQRAVGPYVVARYQVQDAGYPPFYPVVLAGVPPVIGRQTELVHQRVMQMAHAAKLMLGSAAHVPPGFGDPIDLNSIKVVLVGGSNGGHQALWALQDQQDKIHGVFSAAINPSIQRLYSEQEVAYTLGHLSGANISGAQLSAHEAKDWQHWAWQRGRQIRDFSIMGQTLLGRMTRPVCCYVGDEDVTSTGTDWVRLLAGGAYPASGSGLTAGANHLAFAIADKRCHDGGTVNNPCGSPFFGYPSTVYEHELLFDVCAQVHASSATATPVAPMPATGSFDRDFDDPSEWAFARQWTPPPAGGELLEDTTFFQTAQPGFAGTQLGRQESMIISGGRIYVGGTEGVVTEFEIDPADPVRRPLRASRRAQPRSPSGTLLQQGDPLGHAAFGLVKTSTGFVVGTRRHLIRLNSTMQELGRVALGWEQAKPYRLRVGEIFSQWPGSEIVCVSDHGGLLVFSDSLAQSFEYREPGIKDVVLAGVSYPSAGTQSKTALSLLSERGVAANITLHDPGSSPPSGFMAELQAASAPIHEQPMDMEVQDIGGAKYLIVATITGSPERYVLRSYEPSTMNLVWQREYPTFGGSAPLSGASDLATISVDPQQVGGDDAVPGEHIVLLMGDAIQFHDESGFQTVRRDLGGQNGYPMARQASAIAVGELSTGGPGGPYEQEIAIATQTGHVVWFHANELVATGALPATLQIGQAVQPRTNQALSCTWCMARRGSNSFLHVLDQSGLLWQVQGTGAISLLAWNDLASGTVAWADVPAPAGPTQSGQFFWSPSQTSQITGAVLFTTKQPENERIVVYEPNVLSSGPGSMNWKGTYLGLRYFENFALFGRGGGARVRSNGGYELHAWAESGWGEHLLGHVVDPVNSAYQMSAAWSSTGLEPTLGGPWATNPGYLHIRNVNPGFAYTSFSAVRPFEVGGVSYVAVGCPGGRVRIVRPGTTNPAVPMGAIVAESADFGHGGGAMAVRVSGNTVDIFFGTLTHHTPRGGYPSALPDGEVLTGSVHWLRWTGPSSSGIPLVTQLELPPSSADRGGFGVCGICLADVLDNPTIADELIVSTLGGDFAVFDVDSSGTLAPRYRSWASGGVGLHNSINATNLGASGPPAIYCAGSLGVRKWRRP